KPVAHPRELLHGELLLGVLAGLLDLILGVVQVGEGLFLLLARLVALVLVELVLGLAHLAGGVAAGAAGPLGVQLGQTLELPLQLLLVLGLFLGQLLELLVAHFGVGILLGLARRLEVLGLPLAQLAHLLLGLLELLDQPG